MKAPGCLIVTPGRDKRLWQTIRIARLVGTGSSRCNNKTARGSLPHIIAYEGSTALSTARFWLKPEQETRRATPSTVQLLTAGLCRHVHRRWPGNILVRCCGTLTLRSGAARSAISWSQPNAHADLLSRANANACDHDPPGPAAPAGATLRSSCCTFHNRIGTRPAAALHLVCAVAVVAALCRMRSRLRLDPAWHLCLGAS